MSDEYSNTDKDRIVSLKITFADSSRLSWSRTLKGKVGSGYHYVMLWITFVQWFHVKKDSPSFTIRWSDNDKESQTTVCRKDIKYFEVSEVLANV